MRVVHFCNDLNVGSRRLKAAEDYFSSHCRDVETDLIQGDPVQEVVPYAENWEADLIVAGNSAKNLLLRKLFGETALQLLRGSPLPLFLAQ